MVKEPGAARLSGVRMSIKSVPLSEAPLVAKPNVGGLTLVGVFVPLSVQTLPRLQNPCSVGGLTSATARAGVALNARAAGIAVIASVRRVLRMVFIEVAPCPRAESARLKMR